MAKETGADLIVDNDGNHKQDSGKAGKKALARVLKKASKNQDRAEQALNDDSTIRLNDAIIIRGVRIPRDTWLARALINSLLYSKDEDRFKSETFCDVEDVASVHEKYTEEWTACVTNAVNYNQAALNIFYENPFENDKEKYQQKIDNKVIIDYDNILRTERIQALGTSEILKNDRSRISDIVSSTFGESVHQALLDNAPGKNLGSLLATARKASGLTQAEIAKRMGSDGRAIRRLEAGEGNPTIETISKYVAVLDGRFQASIVLKQSHPVKKEYGIARDLRRSDDEKAHLAFDDVAGQQKRAMRKRDELADPGRRPDAEVNRKDGLIRARVPKAEETKAEIYRARKSISKQELVLKALQALYKLEP